MNNFHLDSRIGLDLADRLGLSLPHREGHDLAGQCIACASSDAFRLHQKTGVGQCYSCGGKWSPFHLAETVLKNREQAKALMVELGVFERMDSQITTATDPIEEIARQKGVTVASLRAYGARACSQKAIDLPAYGPDGKRCTNFSMKVGNSKGLFAKGKPAGLFFPHVDGKVRLPQPGETWHLVEGPKDAAALCGLELLACGLNTCRLAAKFARHFAGVDVILIPDRDRAGEKGSDHSAGVLRGVARSVRIAVLPAEFQESGGADVRDVLRRDGGREQVLQAIADARVPEGWDEEESSEPPEPSTATREIAMPEGEPVLLEVYPAGKDPQRLVVARRGEVEHRDRINPDSSVSRDRFIKKMSKKFGIPVDDLFPLIDTPITQLAQEIDEKQSSAGYGGEVMSQATQAASIAEDWDLWHTSGDVGYATIPMANHRETWPLKSQTIKHLVGLQYYRSQGETLGSDALTATINLLCGRASFEGAEHEVHVRIAEHEGRIYLDLCDQDWQAVEISSEGWQVVDEPPVRFRRSRGMETLPVPVQGGSVEELRSFLNVDDDAWKLILAWVVAALRPRGPFPILALVAEQGSGKSTVGRMLRALIDPNTAPLRVEPKDPRDLMIAANNSWCLALDNLSHVPSWLSDALCRLSTGGGFATRELYSDMDEVIFDSQRPLLLTSIEEVATRSDLLDRALLVELPMIPEDRRRPESELLAAFKEAHPRILGAILDVVVMALRELPTTQLDKLPRMADFAIWATAAEAGFGWPKGTFLETYQRNRDSVNEIAIEAQVIAAPLLEFLEHQGRWEGSAAKLLEALEQQVGAENLRRMVGWPKNARSLSGRLSRIAPNLRADGWQMNKGRSSKNRLWIIQRASDAPATTPSPPPSLRDHGEAIPDAANWSNVFFDDANDANDAKRGTSRKHNPLEWFE